jgi:photosystem II stability/assembly factor-like uncharacterized protein
MDLSPGERARRAATLIGLAVVAVLVAGVVYRRPRRAAPAGPPAPRPAPPPQRSGLGSSVFADADHGAVSMYGGAPGNSAVYLTRDGGRTWTRDAAGPGAVILSPPGATALVVGRLGPDAAVRVSDDGGRSWRTLPAPPSLGPAIQGRPSVLDRDHVWWVRRALTPGDASAPVELWRTVDGGRTWTRLAAAGVPDAGFESDPVWVSTDDGVTWQSRVAVLPAGVSGAILTSVTRNALFGVGERPEPGLTAGTGMVPVLLRSRDGGAHWEEIRQPPRPAG